MAMTGELFVGYARVGREQSFRATNPANGELLRPAFSSATPADVDHVCQLAVAAFDAFRATSSADRAAFLESVAQQIEGLGDELIERANLETGLPLVRLTGERGRTTAQLRLFAAELRVGGAWSSIVRGELRSCRPVQHCRQRGVG
jgi:NADP-dependent aldehyde dehydrogenase